MEKFAEIISRVDDFVWGPVMLVLLVGTGIFLTFRLGFASWRNLGYALRLTLSKEARTKSLPPTKQRWEITHRCPFTVPSGETQCRPRSH